MLFYNSDFQTICFFRNSSILEQSWSEKSRILSDVGFMEELGHFIDYIKRFKPESIIIDIEKMFYHVRRDLVPFIGTIFQSANIKGIKRVAILESDDSITQHLIHEIIDNSNLKNFNIKFFKNEELALEWINTDEAYHNEETQIFQVA